MFSPLIRQSTDGSFSKCPCFLHRKACAALALTELQRAAQDLPASYVAQHYLTAVVKQADTLFCASSVALLARRTGQTHKLILILVRRRIRSSSLLELEDDSINY